MKNIFVLCIIFLTPIISLARTYIATTPGEIRAYTDSLQAGDTLLVQEGWYDMNWNIRDRFGTPSDWIVIQAMSDSVVINGIAYDNVIDVYNCHYVELKGFEITDSYGADGIDGIKFRTTSDHFIMEDLHIHDITGVGISANPGGQSFTYLTIRYCHIHHIDSVGEGMYLGNHDGLSPVHHCLVEFNWVHDCHPRKGIQFKRSTYLNVIQDNVVYNCDEAGIVLYKTDQASAADNNIVRRNAIWNTSEGIFAVGQTDIDNNVIFDCSYGINVRNYGGWGMEDLYIRNNTIYSCPTTCLRLDDWNNATGEMVSINNACYQDNISNSAIQAPNGIGPGVVEYNRHYGQSQVGGSTLGNPPAQEFINPSTTPGVVDLYPLGSATLVDSGTSAYGAPNDDFNWFPRPVNGLWDVGAYEWSQSSNPGWQIQPGFKEIYIGIKENRHVEVKNLPVGVLLGTNTIKFCNLNKGSIIKIYDTSGRLIHTSGKVSAHSYNWNTTNETSGIYFYSVTTRKVREKYQGKIVVIR
jgi:parallel beta-helix repeat protein